MPSKESRMKALFICSSHLTVIGMFYGAAALMYICSTQFLPQSQTEQHHLCFLRYCQPSPESLIYNLRNKVVIGALSRLMAKYMMQTHSTL